MLAGEPNVNVRFTYDINGILEVEAHCAESGSNANKLIVKNRRLSESEIAIRLVELNKLKTPQREEDSNKLLIARGQRLFEEFSGPVRAEIMTRLLEFESALDGRANPARIAMLRVKLSDYFDQLDAFSENQLFYGETQDID